MPSAPEIEDDALALVAVFPLPQVVLFPSAIMPLHIFEPRYRRMLADSLASTGALVMAQLDRRGSRMSNVAGVGLIVEHQPLPDGRSNIVLAGCARVRLDEVVSEDPACPYKRAKATRLRDLDFDVSEGERAALLGAATMFAGEVKKHDPTFRFRMPQGTDGGRLADLCASQLVVDAHVRQVVLEELDPRARVRLVIDQLALQHGAIASESKGNDRGGWGGAPS